jgi:hypothetical protein
MKKSHIISFVILFITYVLPFRFAVLDVDASHHLASTFGVLFTAIGAMAGIYYLIKDDAEKSHDAHDAGGSHH